MMDLEIICVDCEEQWLPNQEPVHCICDDPAPDAWLVFIRDSNGKWVRYMLKEMELRHG